MRSFTLPHSADTIGTSESTLLEVTDAKLYVFQPD
ncbi:hypothetical protein CJA_0514 [Cellvibrio japonicus Ueda107]|uniref:Uncharacterized protein n=1 Tax=Cellvibrio japonicus (strain Ueda107) TaxID=498211 RepID=B3PJ03_CELJU|nr:hypothetical protein CJA_0514 [Cellvibrio japonicus Ueda107]